MTIINNQKMCVGMYTIFLFLLLVNLKKMLFSTLTIHTNIQHCPRDLSYYKFFWIIRIQYIDRPIPYEARSIHGTRYLYSIQKKSFQNGFAFDSRKQTCFCHICTENVESIEVCENVMNDYVKHWKHRD